MGKYISQADGESALSAQTVAQLYVDDASSGVVNVQAITDNIDRAEGEVDSFLLGVTVESLSTITGADRLLRGCALDFFVAFSFERHPEYARTFGDNPRASPQYTRAKERMLRIQAATQRLPDQTKGANPPRNVGGIVRSDGPRMMIQGVDGTNNGAGF